MPRRSTAALIVLALLGAIGLVSPASATDYSVSATPSATTVLVKRYINVSGAVLPGSGKVVRSRKAIIQQYRSGRWRTLKKARIQADGSFTGRVRFKSKGIKRLRVYKKRTSQSAAVASAEFSVTVVRRGAPLPAPATGAPVVSPPPPSQAPTIAPPPSEAWKPLTAADIVERGGTDSGTFSDVGAAYTNGGLTPRTLQGNIPGATKVDQAIFADWTLNRRCSLLTARVGLDDTSDPQSNQRVQVLLDGVVAFAQDMSVGQSVNLSLPVANAQRVRLQTINLTSASQAQYVNFGAAQVLCTP